MKTLVIYYSLEGHVRLLADTIANTVDADCLELKPKQKVPSKGFKKYFFGGSQVIRKKTPELEPFNVDPTNYDFLFIGTPVWAGNFVPAVRTMLAEVKLKDKKIALFSSHRGGKGNVFENLRKKLHGNEIVGELDLNEKKDSEENLSETIKWSKDVLEKA